MKTLKSLIAATLGLVMSSPALGQEGDDKIGTVDMKKLVGEYHKTAETAKAFKGYEADIKQENDTRLENIRAIVEEAKKLQKQGEEPSLTREKKNKIFQEFNRKQQEVQGLDRDRIAWLKRKQAALNEKAKIDYGEVRKEILEKVRAYGETEGFDFIFDRSGLSGGGVPILSYTKDATDLTPVLLELINKDAPEDGGEDDLPDPE